MSPETRKLMLAPRLEQLQAMLARAATRGEATPEAEDVIDHLLAPLYMRAILGLPIDERYADKLVKDIVGETDA